MRSYITYDWMVACGLGLKGLPLALFALTASYNRRGCKMYESRESLAAYLGYSEKQVGKALQSLVSAELLMCRKSERHREFCINFLLIKGILEKKSTRDNPISEYYTAFLKSCKPMRLEEQSSCPDREQTSPMKENNLPVEGEESSTVSEKKVPIMQEQSSPNNIYDKNLYNPEDNVLPSLSRTDLIDLLFHVFFFKNNCSPMPELEKFIDFYEGREWKLRGGNTITTITELIRIAESWTVKEMTETGFRASFMKGWKEVYKIAPEHLKKEVLRVKTLRQTQTSARIKCPEKLTDWLNQEKQTIEIIFRSQVTNNYKIEWV